MSVEIVGFLSLAFLIIIQIVIASYGYGKLSEKVNNVCNAQVEYSKRLLVLERSMWQKDRKD